MGQSGSHALHDTITILSTIDPAQSGCLEKIVLEVKWVEWFSENSLVDCEENFEEHGGGNPAGRKKQSRGGLDTILSGLAKASISMRGKRLAFTLVVLECDNNRELMPTVRKWLLKLLPCFKEFGLLHVHYLRGSQCRPADNSCLCYDKPGCLAEDFEDGFSEGGSSENNS